MAFSQSYKIKTLFVLYLGLLAFGKEEEEEVAYSAELSEEEESQSVLRRSAVGYESFEEEEEYRQYHTRCEKEHSYNNILSDLVPVLVQHQQHRQDVFLLLEQGREVQGPLRSG